jgi:hypothetical protein
MGPTGIYYLIPDGRVHINRACTTDFESFSIAGRGRSLQNFFELLRRSDLDACKSSVFASTKVILPTDTNRT